MKSLSDRDSAVIWHPFTPLTEMQRAVVRAQGALLYMEDGSTLIDAISSWWTNLHGHCHPEIARAISEQASSLEHVIFAGFTHEPAVELAEKLLENIAQGHKRVFFSDNGSTAVEVALKLAIQYWWNQGSARHAIVSLSNGYHGDTFGSMSVSGRGIFTAPYAKHLFEVFTLAAPEIGLSQDQQDAIIGRFEELMHSPTTAAFIFEPMVQGSGGMRMLDVQALNRMLQIAASRRIPIIADEVMTGFYRTGRLFASEYLDVSPDIICLSKGITGGALPLGVTTCTDEIQSSFQQADRSKMFFHGHSYTANPLACSAALASFKLCLSDECKTAVERIAASQRCFAEELSEHPNAAHVRTLGTILAFNVVTKQNSSYLHPLRDKLYNFFIKSGVLLRPLGDVVYVLPPYCISDEQLCTVYRAVRESLDACL